MTRQELEAVQPDVKEISEECIIPREQLFTGLNHLFVGKEHGAPITFFWVRSPPGHGPRLHRHPYMEVFIVDEGQATFTLGDKTVMVEGGRVVIVTKDTPHKFVNSGLTELRLIAVHCSSETISEYLE